MNGLEITMKTPVETWQEMRKRLHDLLWPTEEEAREYRRILRSLEREEWLRRGQTDARLPQRKRGAPPHRVCPCDLCGRYWQGFWAQL